MITTTTTNNGQPTSVAISNPDRPPDFSIVLLFFLLFELDLESLNTRAATATTNTTASTAMNNQKLVLLLPSLKREEKGEE